MFVEAASAHPGGQDRMLAVVIGPEDASAEQVAALSPKARVVVAQHGHEIESAFEVQGYPAFALVGDGRVVEVSGDVNAVVTGAKAVAS